MLMPEILLLIEARRSYRSYNQIARRKVARYPAPLQQGGQNNVPIAEIEGRVALKQERLPRTP